MAPGSHDLDVTFTKRHMASLARDFAFPCVPSMVRTWGYKRTFHMAASMVNARGWGWATNGGPPR